jgi:hypothetical protein
MNMNKYNKEKNGCSTLLSSSSVLTKKRFFPPVFFLAAKKTEKIKVRMSTFDPGAGWWPWSAGQGGGGG